VRSSQGDAPEKSYVCLRVSPFVRDIRLY
jgi:hypothetical protein